MRTSSTSDQDLNSWNLQASLSSQSAPASLSGSCHSAEAAPCGQDTNTEVIAVPSGITSGKGTTHSTANMTSGISATGAGITHGLVRFGRLYGVYYIPASIRNPIKVGELVLTEAAHGENTGVLVADFSALVKDIMVNYKRNAYLASIVAKETGGSAAVERLLLDVLYPEDYMGPAAGARPSPPARRESATTATTATGVGLASASTATRGSDRGNSVTDSSGARVSEMGSAKESHHAGTPRFELYGRRATSGLPEHDDHLQRLPRVLRRGVNKDKKKVYFSRKRDSEALHFVNKILFEKNWNSLLSVNDVSYQVDFLSTTLFLHGGEEFYGNALPQPGSPAQSGIIGANVTEQGNMNARWGPREFTGVGNMLSAPLRTDIVEFRFTVRFPELAHLTRRIIGNKLNERCEEEIHQYDRVTSTRRNAPTAADSPKARQAREHTAGHGAGPLQLPFLPHTCEGDSGSANVSPWHGDKSQMVNAPLSAGPTFVAQHAEILAQQAKQLTVFVTATQSGTFTSQPQLRQHFQGYPQQQQPQPIAPTPLLNTFMPTVFSPISTVEPSLVSTMTTNPSSTSIHQRYSPHSESQMWVKQNPQEAAHNQQLQRHSTSCFSGEFVQQVQQPIYANPQPPTQQLQLASFSSMPSSPVANAAGSQMQGPYQPQAFLQGQQQFFGLTTMPPATSATTVSVGQPRGIRISMQQGAQAAQQQQQQPTYFYLQRQQDTTNQANSVSGSSGRGNFVSVNVPFAQQQQQQQQAQPVFYMVAGSPSAAVATTPPTSTGAHVQSSSSVQPSATNYSLPSVHVFPNYQTAPPQ